MFSKEGEWIRSSDSPMKEALGTEFSFVNSCAGQQLYQYIHGLECVPYYEAALH